jgi:hypothetical protein
MLLVLLALAFLVGFLAGIAADDAFDLLFRRSTRGGQDEAQ